ncbi:MAG: TetR/AcrR family transcriptional regulator [Flavobacteriaceae bacterium]
MQKTLKHEIKADYLLEKGMELLWAKGYNATSVNDVVTAAGVPKGSFYFYFDSKEEFVAQAIDKYFTDKVSPVFEILNKEGTSPKERILAFYEHRVKVLKEEMDCRMGCLASNLGNEMAEHSEVIRKKIAEKEYWAYGKLIDVIQEGQTLGEISRNLSATDLATFMEDAGKGAMITMKEMNSAYPIDNVMNVIRKVLLK